MLGFSKAFLNLKLKKYSSLVLCLVLIFVLFFLLQEGLVNVGWMDCGTQGELCDNLDISSSTTAYFPPGATIINNKEKGGVLV